MHDTDERRLAAWEAYARLHQYPADQVQNRKNYFRECFEAGWRAANEGLGTPAK